MRVEIKDGVAAVPWGTYKGFDRSNYQAPRSGETLPLPTPGYAADRQRTARFMTLIWWAGHWFRWVGHISRPPDGFAWTDRVISDGGWDKFTLYSCQNIPARALNSLLEYLRVVTNPPLALHPHISKAEL